MIDGGTTYTSVVHINDAARLCLLAAEKTAAGECYNCVSGTKTTIGEILVELGHVLNLPTKPLTLEEAKAQIGPMFASYLTSSCRGSSQKAITVLEWQAREATVIECLKNWSE